MICRIYLIPDTKGFSQYFLQPHQQGEPFFQYHLLIALLNFSHLLKAKYALLHNQ